MNDIESLTVAARTIAEEYENIAAIDPESPELQDIMARYIEIYEGVEAIALSVKELESRSAAKKEMAVWFSQESEKYDNAANRLKKGLLTFMKERDITRIDNPILRITRCRNGGKEPLEILEQDYDVLPDEYINKVVVPDYQAIREALQSGRVLEFARLKERGEHIRIA